jgi:hypothetical protein
MLRFDEIGLFLVPFALFVVWRILGPRMPPWLVWAAAVAVMAMAGGTVWYGLDRRTAPGSIYDPAQLEGGRIISGHTGKTAPP